MQNNLRFQFFHVPPSFSRYPLFSTISMTRREEKRREENRREENRREEKRREEKRREEKRREEIDTSLLFRPYHALGVERRQNLALFCLQSPPTPQERGISTLAEQRNLDIWNFQLLHRRRWSFYDVPEIYWWFLIAWSWSRLSTFRVQLTAFDRTAASFVHCSRVLSFSLQFHQLET